MAVMKNLARLLFLLLLTAVIVSSQEYQTQPPSPPPPAEEQSIGSLGVQLITEFLSSDFVKRKIQFIFDVIDLKARLIYAITSFCTSENLIALRRFLDWVCRFASFINRFLPTLPDEDPKIALLGLAMNMFNNWVSPGPTEAPYYIPPPVENTPTPLVFSPPSYYDSPNLADVNNNVQEGAQELSSNVKRSLEKDQVAEASEAVPKLSELSEDEIRTMLRNKDGVMKLTKLISSSKR